MLSFSLRFWGGMHFLRTLGSRNFYGILLQQTDAQSGPDRVFVPRRSPKKLFRSDPTFLHHLPHNPLHFPQKRSCSKIEMCILLWSPSASPNYLPTFDSFLSLGLGWKKEFNPSIQPSPTSKQINLHCCVLFGLWERTTREQRRNVLLRILQGLRGSEKQRERKRGELKTYPISLCFRIMNNIIKIFLNLPLGLIFRAFNEGCAGREIFGNFTSKP